MELTRLLDAAETLAPLTLAEPWDKVGLHVGERGQQVRRALLCIDLTRAVIEEAAKAGCELIVAYHPPIFDPVTRLTDDDARGRALLEAVRRRIAVYSPHTALDAAEGGVTDWLCDGLGAGARTVIQPAPAHAHDVKIVTFVPPANTAAVRDAMFDAGAGQIGDYSHCSFSLPGRGTFKGDPGTDPYIGRPGELVTTDETRLEVACRMTRLPGALAALKRAHPYEEPAIDVLPIEVAPSSDTGAGRIVTLDRPASLSALTRRIKSHLNVSHVQVVSGPRTIRSIAVCPGAGGSLLTPLRDVDAVFTGELRHHDTLALRERGVAVLLAGHTETERPYLPVYRRRLAERCPGVTFRVSRRDTPPACTL